MIKTTAQENFVIINTLVNDTIEITVPDSVNVLKWQISSDSIKLANN